jgi:DNA polymerase III delta prime subunit
MQSFILLDPDSILAAKPDSNTYLLESLEGKQIGIKEVRSFIHWAAQTGFADGVKTGIIRQAQFLSRDAQHALLKTLEEPVRQTTLVLTLDQPTNILETVRSRCTTYVLNALSDEQLATWRLAKGEAEQLPTDLLSFEEFLSWNDAQRWLWGEELFKKKSQLGQILTTWQGELQAAIPQSLATSFPLLLRCRQLLDEADQSLARNIMPRLVFDALLIALGRLNIPTKAS